MLLVYLWEPRQDKDLTKLDWRRHRFGVTYLVVNADCRTEQIDDIVSCNVSDAVTYYTFECRLGLHLNKISQRLI